MAPHHAHTDKPEVDCERRTVETGWWAFIRRNAPVVLSVLLVGGAFMAIVAWRDGKRDDIKAGVEAAAEVKKVAAKVDAVDRDYVGKKELEGHLASQNNRMTRLEDKFDKLYDIIIDRLPDK